MASIEDDEPTARHDPSWREAVSVWLMVLVVFAAFAVQPTPGENEAHYLAKAKHFWQPEWCAGDLFLESANAHWLFYATFGALTKWFSLSATAWMGRLLAWSLLAWAFARMCHVVGMAAWLAPLSAACFALLTHWTQLSGEWVLGGVEAKGFAWPLALLGVAELSRGRLNLAWLSFGAATAWHPLVGGWSLAAAIYPGWPMRRQMGEWTTTILGFVFIVVGVAPIALHTMIGPAEERLSDATAWPVYVFQRLPHHLLPTHFSLEHWLGFGAGLAAWLYLGGRCRHVPELQVVRRFGWATLVIGALGGLTYLVTMNSPTACASIMHFYWFRSLDVLLPLGTAMCLGRLLQQIWPASRPRRGLRLSILVVSLLTVFALRPKLSAVPAAEQGAPPDRFAGWVEACQWIERETPNDAVFITPRLRQSFKWYAQRGEVVNWKDVPQDAPHLVEWWLRMSELFAIIESDQGQSPERHWIKSLTQHSPDTLRALGKRSGAGYLLCGAEPELALPRLYHNNFYAVYRLTDAESSTP